MRVSPDPPETISSPGDVVRLTCRASINPSICLWKTPYQAIYSIGGGRVWEDGRISSPPSSDSCALLIQAVELKDDGIWQCEVGAVVEGEFTTTTAETSLTVVTRALGGGGGGRDSRVVGLEGAEIVVRCGGGRGRQGPCRWTSPASHTFSLQPGDYAERGRLQADLQCGLRISSLQERDGGTWTCQASTESGRAVETVTHLVIESKNYCQQPDWLSHRLTFQLLSSFLPPPPYCSRRTREQLWSVTPTNSTRHASGRRLTGAPSPSPSTPAVRRAEGSSTSASPTWTAGL